ncbi:hypothetical protein EBZ37_14000, partial [bacterium]|nr:hypothetical protein [bacterium]
MLYELQSQEPSTAKKLLLQAAAAYFHGLRAAYSIDHVSEALGLNPGQEDVSITMLDLLAKAGLTHLFEGTVLPSNASKPRSFEIVLLVDEIPEDLTEAALERLGHPGDEALSFVHLPKLLFCDFQAGAEAATIPELVTLSGQKYQLQSVIVHDGPSHRSGHYYCFVFDPACQRWCHIDDNRCQFVEAPPAAKPRSGLRIIFRRVDVEAACPTNLVPDSYRDLVLSDNCLCQVEYCLQSLEDQFYELESFQAEFEERCAVASAILDSWQVHPPSELEGRFAHWFATCHERERICPELLVLMGFDSIWRPCLPELLARPMECFKPLYETFGLDLTGCLILGRIATKGKNFYSTVKLDNYKPPWEQWVDGK